MSTDIQDSKYFLAHWLMQFLAEPENETMDAWLKKNQALVERVNPLTFSVTTAEPNGEHKYYISLRVAY